MIAFRYADKNTIIHRLNPFCKLAWITDVLVFALIFDNPIYISLLFLSTLPVIYVGGILREWASLMKLTFFLCIAIIVINAVVSNEGAHVLAEAPFKIPAIGVPRITLEALFYGAIMCLRLLAVLTAFTILTFTIHPDDLMLAMIKLKLPYKSVLVTSLATRFIPTLIGDAQRITDVQRSRGVELDKGRFVNRIKSRMTILIPLLSNSLDRAIQVAEAMESKAFGAGKRRTYYKQIPFSLTDRGILLMTFLTLGCGIFLRLNGCGEYDYYPSVSEIQMNAFEISMLIILISLLVAIIPLAKAKRRIDLD